MKHAHVELHTYLSTTNSVLSKRLVGCFYCGNEKVTSILGSDRMKMQITFTIFVTEESKRKSRNMN